MDQGTSRDVVIQPGMRLAVVRDGKRIGFVRVSEAADDVVKWDEITPDLEILVGDQFTLDEAGELL